MDLKIKKYTKKEPIPQRPISKQKIIPSHASVTLICGSTNAGKTNLVCNMLTNPYMYGGSSEPCNKKGNNYFDEIYVFSGSKDQTIRQLIDDKILEEKNLIKPDPKEIKKIFDKQEKLLSGKKDVHQIPRILVILDDCLQYKDFMYSDEVSQVITSGRHCSISSWTLTQYFYKVAPVCRTNADMIIQFRPNRSEINILDQMYRPAHVEKKKDFVNLINEAIKPTKEDSHPFLVICKSAHPDEMFRRNFDEYLII